MRVKLIRCFYNKSISEKCPWSTNDKTIKQPMTTHQYFMETKRLRFRTWTKDDLNLALGLWGDYKVTKLFDNRGQLSEKQVKDRLSKEIRNQELFGVQYWPIFEKKGNRHIGASGLRPKNIEEDEYELGFHICVKHWRKGYAFEAANGVINYAFSRLNASSLFAGHNPENKASQQLLLKLGFSYTHDEFYEPTGLMHPSYTLNLKDSLE